MDKQKGLKENLIKLKSNTDVYILALKSLSKYKGNSHYKKKVKSINLKIRKLLIYLDRVIDNFPRYDTLKENLLILLSDTEKNTEDSSFLLDLEMLWEDIFLDLENINPISNTHIIPDEIPFTEVRFDLEEAIKDFKSGCFISAIVMCRRSYEGALVTLYTQIEKKSPTKELKCKNCKNIVKGNLYMGITELHRWAIEQKIISDKFKSIGYLIPSLGAGGAHPAEKFPRDAEVANISIITTISLLKQIYKK